MTHWLRPTDVCVVTGGCNGLGAAILRRLAVAGCPTVALDIAVPSDEEAKPLEKSTEVKTSSVPSNQITADTAKSVNSIMTKTEIVIDTNHHSNENFSGSSGSAAANSSSLAEGEETSSQTHEDSAETQEEELKPSLTIKCDVRSQKDLAHAREVIFENFQRYPSVLICNAGVRHPLNSIALTNFEDIEETIEVNLAGPLKCIRTFLPDIIEANRGFVVTIGSALGLICPKGLSVYGASKAGVLGFHEALEQDISSYKDIHALLVCPGQIDTSMFADVRTPSEILAPIVEPDKLARKIVKRITKAKTTTVYAPAYVRYLSLVRAVPTPLANLARKWSGVDKVYDEILEERRRAETANNVEVPEYRSGVESPGSASEKSLEESAESQARDPQKETQPSEPKEPRIYVTKTHGAAATEPSHTKNSTCRGPRRNWFRSAFTGHHHSTSQSNPSLCDGYVDTGNPPSEETRTSGPAHHDGSSGNQNETSNVTGSDE